MSTDSYISLIDLSRQFPFEIDDRMKKEICFGETLVISCCHEPGDIHEETSESEWSCTQSDGSEKSEKPKDEPAVVKKPIEEKVLTKPVAEEEENDFHFFFFPDCESKPKEDGTASVILVDGIPQINPAIKLADNCDCKKDKEGKCDCFTKIPCYCGAKTLQECKCRDAENICICHENDPQPYCTCKPNKVCMCLPDNKPRPVCKCTEVNKPCVCYPGKFPCPVCTCEFKPKFIEDIKSVEMGEEYVSEEQNNEVLPPCTCQDPGPKKYCFCIKGDECICKQDACVCGVQKTCFCERVDGKEPICAEDDAKSICSCPTEKVCTCNTASPMDCPCFPKKIECTCGDPENCKCFKVCDCLAPCLCDIQPKKEEDVCTCFDKKVQPLNEIICTCPRKEETKKLKKVRAGKHGYRWCHDVDPRHTYFDYAYERHDKISYEIQEAEKFKILGLYEEPEQQETSDVHNVKAPEYLKKIKRPSLDCCSAVGGISISVETIGEDKNKFLVQVVSHSSKEGAKTGSKLVSILDMHLHTLEENRTEHISKKNITKEQRSYMTICESGYYNKVTRICGERHFAKRFYHSFEAAHNFLLEGANVVLLRYFGISRHRGNVKTDTVLIDGTICESIYVCLGVSQAIVNQKPMFVVKVERHIIEPSGYIHQTLTVLTLRGYLISHEWADTCYVFHLNPLLRVYSDKDEIEQHEPLRANWRNDLQLMSDYLDFKSARSSEGARYVSENGELTAIIRDYLQTLLLLRPHDALHFTRHYFGTALSALDLPHDDYFDPCMKQVRYFFFEE